LIVTFSSCIVVKERTFNQGKYLDSHSNSVDIYENKNAGLFYPIMDLQPHENVKGRITKLLLVEFKNDPDLYMIELQEVNDGSISGRIALIYKHKNTQVDVYYTPGLKLNLAGYTSLLNNVTLNENNFSSTFENTDKGLFASLNLTDRNNRKIELSIRENKKKMKSHGLLAPIGSGSKLPDKFPFIYLKGFTMIKQKGTGITVKIDEKNRTIDKIPALVNFEKVYNAKYSFENVMIEWNKNINTILKPLDYRNKEALMSYQENKYELIDNNGHPEIKSISKNIEENTVKIHFSPAIPDLLNLKNNSKIKGNFAIQIDSITGITGGNYKIYNSNDTIHFDLFLQKGWQPMPGKLWLKSYNWKCDIIKTKPNIKIETNWKRINN